MFALHALSNKPLRILTNLASGNSRFGRIAFITSANSMEVIILTCFSGRFITGDLAARHFKCSIPYSHAAATEPTVRSVVGNLATLHGECSSIAHMYAAAFTIIEGFVFSDNAVAAHNER